MCASACAVFVLYVHLTGNFYTLTTGSNEKRWNRVKDRLETTVRSFSLLF